MGGRACLPEALNDRVFLCVATGVVDMRPHVNEVQALVIAASYQRLRDSRRRLLSLYLLSNICCQACLFLCDTEDVMRSSVHDKTPAFIAEYHSCGGIFLWKMRWNCTCSSCSLNMRSHSSGMTFSRPALKASAVRLLCAFSIKCATLCMYSKRLLPVTALLLPPGTSSICVHEQSLSQQQ